MSSSEDRNGGRPRGTARSALDAAGGVLFRGFIVLVPFVITLYILWMNI